MYGAHTASSAFTVDEAIGTRVNQLMFRSKVTRKQLGQVLGITGQAASKKVYGQVAWSVADLYRVADFFGVDITELLPRRVPAPGHDETPRTSVQGASPNVVAGAGFEPTTSGL
ncbi:helix-turn-helix domain-containing protein [Corynebacterium sp.]|uniref:helix-turn-helix domain-containing protein n=1 Tax=Corynebacterium sp. TaxID=1720 RepID=UPI0026DC72E5|nr:helix-turn-helix domain-containing protein [Corynebacterium sp.]MDO4611212.1 helix-turn-helix domain-containing protein [Corynebacterium sp.]